MPLKLSMTARMLRRADTFLAIRPHAFTIVRCSWLVPHSPPWQPRPQHHQLQQHARRRGERRCLARRPRLRDTLDQLDHASDPHAAPHISLPSAVVEHGSPTSQSPSSFLITASRCSSRRSRRLHHSDLRSSTLAGRIPAPVHSFVTIAFPPALVSVRMTHQSGLHRQLLLRLRRPALLSLARSCRQSGPLDLAMSIAQRKPPSAGDPVVASTLAARRLSGRIVRPTLRAARGG